MYFGYRLCNKLKKNVFLCINIITTLSSQTKWRCESLLAKQGKGTKSFTFFYIGIHKKNEN